MSASKGKRIEWETERWAHTETQSAPCACSHEAWKGSSELHTVRVGIFQKATWRCSRSLRPQICHHMLVARLWLAEDAAHQQPKVKGKNVAWLQGNGPYCGWKFILSMNKVKLYMCILNHCLNINRMHLVHTFIFTLNPHSCRPWHKEAINAIKILPFVFMVLISCHNNF